MFKISREIYILQFHLDAAILINGYSIKKGMNIIKRVTPDSKDYVIYNTDFATPYTHFPLSEVRNLLKFLFKGFIENGWVVVDDLESERKPLLKVA
jgi:hypothetical protein